MVKSGNRGEAFQIRTRLDEIWPKLLSEICSDPEFEGMPSATTWLKNVLDLNVPGGKKNRSVFGVCLYNAIVKEEDREPLELILILGWCTEIFQAAALMIDDIMDNSTTRRGKTCWYREKNVGISSGINDALMLEHAGYMTLYKYLEEKDYFPALFRHTHQIVMRTIMGQSMDTRASTQFNLDSFTPELYDQIVTNKTSYYSFYSPAAAALITAGIKDKYLFDAILAVSLRIGFLFQVQDDYLDCFGNPTATGKVGTDIQDGKCTWFIVKAVQLASASQRSILESNYAVNSENAANQVKEIYKELELVDAYRKFEKERYKEIAQLLEEMPKRLPKEPFYNILDTIYKREK